MHGPSSHFGSKDATDNGWTFGGGGEIVWTSGAWNYGAIAGGYCNSVWNTTFYVGPTGSYQVTDWLAARMACRIVSLLTLPERRGSWRALRSSSVKGRTHIGAGIASVGTGGTALMFSFALSQKIR